MGGWLSRSRKDAMMVPLELTARGGLEESSAEAAKPAYELLPGPQVVIEPTRGDPPAESFRRLRAEVFEKRTTPPQVVMVTSPLPAEGKSFVSLNLALSRSRQQPGRALLLDADLRGAVASKWIRPRAPKGLSDILRGATTMDDCLVEVRDPPLVILPSGESRGDPLGAVYFPDLERIVKDLRERFETIIIDTPPVVLFADALVLATLADAVLVVVRAHSTPHNAFEDTMKSLSGLPVVGVILNGARETFVDRSSKYGGYYSHYHHDRKPE